MSFLFLLMFISVSVIGFVLFQIKNDRSFADSKIEPLKPEALKNDKMFSVKKESTETNPRKEQTIEAPKIIIEENSLTSEKSIGSKTEADKKTSAKDKSVLFKKIGSFFKKKKKSAPIKKPSLKPKKESLFVKLFQLFKNKKNVHKTPKNKKTKSGFLSLKEKLELDIIDASADLNPSPLKEEIQDPLPGNTLKSDKSNIDVESTNDSKDQTEDSKNSNHLNELKIQLEALKEKHAKLESLFDEKSIECDKAKISLENEVNNRKEFNKIKDVLEKELKDLKDKNREVQTEMGTSQSEGESFQKRIQQLEEKLSSVEKEIENKNSEIKSLEEKIQINSASETQTSSSPKETIEETVATESSIDEIADSLQEDPPKDSSRKDADSAPTDIPSNISKSVSSEPMDSETSDMGSSIEKMLLRDSLSAEGQKEESLQSTQNVDKDEDLLNHDLQTPEDADKKDNGGEDEDSDYLKLPPDPFKNQKKELDQN